MRKDGKSAPHEKLIGRIKWYRKTFFEGDIYTKLSFIVMGASNIARGQIVKGISYLFLELSFIYYLIWHGIDDLAGLITLGTKEQEMVYNEAKGIYEVVKGDNSMLMLLLGITAIFVVSFFAIVWKANLKSAVAAQEYKANGKKAPGIIDDIRSLFDTNLHKSLLLIPIIGLIITTVLPLFYMILMAFTNYNMTHQPPGKLFTWVGLENFRIMLMSADKLGYTFWRIFEWTLIWAVMATFSNYFLGMFLAILINSKGIKGKGFWRTIFVISVAVPSFVTLLVIRIMMNDHGALNILLMELGFTSKSIPFFTNPAIARITVILVNLWIGIPHTMLITTGILVNIPSELYESARIDGAGPVKSFFHITMPYMIFITTPYLITNFIFNINNFNAIYFLTGGGPSTLEYFKGAGKTDLLVTWLYRLTVESWDYCYAATIGIVIFLISAVSSLIVYRKSASYRKEEEFSNG
jgi:arabinogalactan oligomer/maltooligosaccharide transport system permease protein